MKTTKTIYLLSVETDFDFSLYFRGQLFTDCDINITLANVEELDEIMLSGPFGAPTKPEKRWEWDEAMTAIKANPNKHFSNLGGNRGVEWIPQELIT